MSNQTISMIIPVYNAGAFLPRCLDSLMPQCRAGDEVILVEDGSADDSVAICRRYVDQYPQVSFFQNPDSGVSSARNLGLQKASGAWVCFLDADDWLFPDTLDRLRSQLAEGVDGVYGNYLRGDAPIDGSHRVTRVSPEQLAAWSLDAAGNLGDISRCVTYQSLLFSACWGKLFRREIIEKYAVTFPTSLRLSEDLCFNLSYLSCCGVIALVDRPVYHYRIHDQSVTHRFDASHIDNTCALVGYLYHQFPEMDRTLLDAYTARYVLQLCNRAWSCGPEGVAKMGKLVSMPETISALQHIRREQLSEGKIQPLFYGWMLRFLRRGNVPAALRVGKLYAKVKR